MKKESIELIIIWKKLFGWWKLIVDWNDSWITESFKYYINTSKGRFCKGILINYKLGTINSTVEY